MTPPARREEDVEALTTGRVAFAPDYKSAERFAAQAQSLQGKQRLLEAHLNAQERDHELKELRAEVARLSGERDAVRAAASWLRENWNRDLAHMREAEAEVERLREALEHYVACEQHFADRNLGVAYGDAFERARAALSAGAEREGEGLRTVTLTLCADCLAGQGGECHTPGCALWMSRAPDVPLLRFAAAPAAPERAMNTFHWNQGPCSCVKCAAPEDKS